MADTSATSSASTGPFTADELLARSKAAAEAKAAGKTAGMSAVQKLLAAHGEDGPDDSVVLSPVAKMLAAQQKAADAKKTSSSYEDQDWYLKAKVSELRGQLDFYSRLGGDIANNAMSSIESEIKGLLQKQQDKLAATKADSAAKQAELDKQKAQDAVDSSVPSAKDLLDRAKTRASGGSVAVFAPQTDDDKAKADAVAALLKKVGAKIDTKA
jgi:hypothetical protein